MVLVAVVVHETVATRDEKHLKPGLDARLMTKSSVYLNLTGSLLGIWQSMMAHPFTL